MNVCVFAAVGGTSSLHLRAGWDDLERKKQSIMAIFVIFPSRKFIVIVFVNYFVG